MTRRERIQALVNLRRIELRPWRERSQALRAIDAVLALRPQEPDLLVIKGQLLDRLGEYLEARRLYALAARRDAANVLAAMDMGHSYYYCGRLALALRWYDRAIALLRAGQCWAVWRAEWEEAHWFRAWALAELGRPQAAIACCRHGLARSPRSRALQDLLASFLEGPDHHPSVPGR